MKQIVLKKKNISEYKHFSGIFCKTSLQTYFVYFIKFLCIFSLYFYFLNNILFGIHTLYLVTIIYRFKKKNKEKNKIYQLSSRINCKYLL